MSSASRRLVVAVALPAAVAVVAVRVTIAGGPPDDRLMVVDEEGAIALLDPASGETFYEVPAATVTPDRSALLTTRTASDGANTVLESRDPETGEVSGSTLLPADDLTVRTVSPRGQAVALMAGPRGMGLYEPEARSTTSITVSYLDDRPARTYDVDGNIEPEMFSYDEAGLYVLEFVPPSAPDSYFVRRLDLGAGTLTDTGAPQVGLNPKMRGHARASVLHPGGDQLFTLYTLPQDKEVLAAFIHVIDLKEDWSYCIFLPEPLGTVDEVGIGMGISADGSEVLVADPSTSTLARIDTAALEVVETVGVEQLRDNDAQAAVAMASDGTVYVASGWAVLELTRPALQPVRVWSQNQGPVSDLSLSAAGDELRIGGGGAITLVDRATGEESAVLRAPGRGTLTLLGPPRGSVTQFPLECAC